MPRWNVRHLCACIGLVFLAGCSDADPKVTLLRPMNQFDFVTSNITTSSLTAVPLTAKCSSFIGTVEMTFDKGATWIDATSYDTHNSVCTSGKFNITLSNTSSPLNGMAINNGDTVTVRFRAHPRIGPVVERTVLVKYAPSATIQQGILAGAGTQSGAGYVLRGRVQSHKQEIATGTNLILRGRILE
ncbi:MAG: hypothetical protein J7501_11255 [Bdellovibrio sp.]|nr:hypothetical protein [Bdellovibrio sp.]